MSVVIGAIFGLIGVILGGGVRAWEAHRARKAEAAALLSAICAEVEAIDRLMEHRQHRQGIAEFGEAAERLVAEGRGEEVVDFPSITLKHNYFTVYEASVGKIGLLHPYMADRIARFYTFVKAVQENYDPGSEFNNKEVTAQEAVVVVGNDLPLLDTIHMLGQRIATFRIATPPKGINDPTLLPLPIPEERSLDEDEKDVVTTNASGGNPTETGQAPSSNQPASG